MGQEGRRNLDGVFSLHRSPNVELGRDKSPVYCAKNTEGNQKPEIWVHLRLQMRAKNLPSPGTLL